MAAFPRLRLTAIPPIGGVAAGLFIALAFLTMPGDTLDGIVGASGIASALAVAQPPLGWTARSLLALTAGTGAGAVAWAALFLLVGPGGLFARDGGGRDKGVPAVRRADAHPDAPPRKPFSAADFSPPPPVPAERAIPVDLDQPLARFDPEAVLPVPMEPVRAVPPLPRLPAPVELAPGERIAAFEIAGPHEATAAEDANPSIEALLSRLESGARRRRPGLSRVG